MLYSVVISDLVYKLQELENLYDDKVAIEILEEINTKQKILAVVNRNHI